MSTRSRNFRVKYLMGHPLIAEPMDVTLEIESDGIALRGKQSARIGWKAITKISAESQGEVRRRVSLGRAAIGLVIFGPVGGLIGAGLRKKEDTRQTYVTIAHHDATGGENLLLLESKEAYAIVTRLASERHDYIAASARGLTASSALGEAQYVARWGPPNQRATATIKKKSCVVCTWVDKKVEIAFDPEGNVVSRRDW